MRACGCPEKVRHREGCPKSHRRKDFFRKKHGMKKSTALMMECLDCHGYRSLDPLERKGAKCRKCGSVRLMDVTFKPKKNTYES